MVGYTFTPSVTPSKEQPGKFDVACRVVYIGDDGVEQFIEHRVWLTSVSDFNTACEFAHQTVKFMLSYYDRMISNLVESMINNKSISGFDTQNIGSKIDQSSELVTNCK